MAFSADSFYAACRAGDFGAVRAAIAQWPAATAAAVAGGGAEAAEAAVSPLHEAAGGGYKRVLSLLVDTLPPRGDARRQAALDRRCGGDATTALWAAAASGHTDCATLLLSCGASPDVRCGADGGTALHAAAVRYPRCCEVLIARGADAAATDAAGRTAAAVASVRCAEAIAAAATARRALAYAADAPPLPPAAAAAATASAAAERSRQMVAVAAEAAEAATTTTTTTTASDAATETKALQTDDDDDAAVTIATWNILADCYTNPRFFPYTPAEARTWAHRQPRLVAEAVRLGGDVVCLQEVDHFAEIAAALAPHGYDGTWTKRPGRKADGSALFWRRDRCRLDELRAVDFDSIARDGRDLQHNVGQVARFVVAASGRSLVVGHGHLFFRDQSLTLLQTAHLRAQALAMARPAEPLFLAGDWNCEPGSEPVRAAMLGSAARTDDASAVPPPSPLVLHDAYAALRPLGTFFGGRIHAPDHLLYANAALAAVLEPRPAQTFLPDAFLWASDHIPLAARFVLHRSS